MKRGNTTKSPVNVTELMTTRVRRLERLARSRDQARLRGVPPVTREAGWATELDHGLAMLGMNVAVQLTADASAASAALDSSGATTGRCGPRETAARRAGLSLSRKDTATLTELAPRLVAWLAKNPGQAALFACDPLAALAHMPKGAGTDLLVKLRRFSEAAVGPEAVDGRLQIARLRVECVAPRAARTTARGHARTKKTGGRS